MRRRPDPIDEGSAATPYSPPTGEIVVTGGESAKGGPPPGVILVAVVDVLAGLALVVASPFMLFIDPSGGALVLIPLFLAFLMFGIAHGMIRCEQVARRLQWFVCGGLVLIASEMAVSRGFHAGPLIAIGLNLVIVVLLSTADVRAWFARGGIVST